MKKLFVVKKYVMAKTVMDAVRKEKLLPPDDVYVDDDWRRLNMTDSKAIGFKTK